jgi:endonuclease YncB( thermonuclease family)
MSLRYLIGLVFLVAAVLSFSTPDRKPAHSERNSRDSHGHSAPREIDPREVITGKVVSIADGDTLTVLDEHDSQHRIRLFGIDAPEKGQAFGNRAKENLSNKVFGKTVRVEVVDVDRYGRQVGRIYLGGRFINLEQARDGYAWRYPEFDRRHEFDAAEAEAREHRRGLWADRDPIPPWEYRRDHAIGGRPEPRGRTRTRDRFDDSF